MPDICQAILDLLRRMEATPESPINLYRIGVPLVGEGYSQNDIIHGLYRLQDDHIIELLDGNRLQVVKRLS